MKRQNKVILLIILLLTAIYVLYRLFFPTSAVIAQHNSSIKDLKAKKSVTEKKLKALYKAKYKKNYPSHFVLLEKRKYSKEFLLLKEELYAQSLKLSNIYKVYGDYFFDELYRLDKHASLEYKEFNISDSELERYLKHDKKRGYKAVDFLLKTRAIALDKYRNALLAMGDFSSLYYALNKRANPFVHPLNISFITTSADDNLNKSLSKRANRKLYLSSYVSPTLHYKLAKTYIQMASLTLLKKDNKGIAKDYIDKARKELLITLLVDKKFYRTFYALPELYIFSFVELGIREPFYLKKAKFLLRHSLLVKALSKRESNKALFLLGKTFYLLANLSTSEKKQILKIYSSDYKDITLAKFRLHYLKKAKLLYKDKLLSFLKKGSSSYKNAFKNYKQVVEELGQ